MRSRILLLALFTAAFFLSGCYTQLQYSQRLNRITDEGPRYSYDGDEEGKPVTKSDSDYVKGYEDGYHKAVEEYPFYYRDYGTANWYARHGFGGRYYYHDPFYDWYYPYGTTFSIRFSYGRPGYLGYLAFADPFEYYWYLSHFRYYRYYRSYPGFYAYYFGPRYYFNHPYFFYHDGYADFVGPGKDSDRKYGRRTLGTSGVNSNSGRVDEGNTRIRTGVQQAATGERRTTIVRSRGNTDSGRSRKVRSRSSSDTRTRVRATGRSGSGSRSSGNGNGNGNGNLERPDTRYRGDQSGVRIGRDADTDSRIGVRVNRESVIRNSDYADRAEIRERLRDYRAPEIDIDQINRTRFDNRINLFRRYNIFDAVPRSSFRNSNVTPSRIKINSSSSDTRNRARVKSSSSSSSSSRSRSSSSGSSSGSSSKKRSRGGN